MFGFLKKKLKEAVEKISGAAKEEVAAEEVEEAERGALLEKKIEEKAIEKEELIREAGMELTPEAREAVEKPVRQILENERFEAPKEGEIESVGEIGAEEKAEISREEAEPPEEETAVEEKIIVKEKIMPEEVPEKASENITEKISEKASEKMPEKIQEKVPAAVAEKTVHAPKKGFLEKLWVKKKIKAEISASPAAKEEKEKPSFFKKISRAISEKTIEESDIRGILWDLQIGLIENDVAVGAAEKITSDLKGALLGKSLPKKGIEETVRGSMRKSIREILDAGELNLEKTIRSKKPFLMLFLGFNGVGKTTTIARVGHLLKREGFSCIFAAADTWRAGAIQQIEEHGSRLGIKVIRQEYGSDPAAVIFDARKYAEAHGIDAILADTAGRSHTNVNLVDELKKICRVNKPDIKVLVLDALTGNDVVEQSKYFNDAVGADAIIITKADVYEKGGSVLSAVHTIRKPILYLGVGQGYGDLEEFDVEKVVENLLE
jgi:fused signal recognition particle receptor